MKKIIKTKKERVLSSEHKNKKIKLSPNIHIEKINTSIMNCVYQKYFNSMKQIYNSERRKSGTKPFINSPRLVYVKTNIKSGKDVFSKSLKKEKIYEENELNDGLYTKLYSDSAININEKTPFNEIKNVQNQKIFKLSDYIVKTIEKNYKNKKSIRKNNIIRSTSQEIIKENKSMKYNIIFPGKKTRSISNDFDYKKKDYNNNNNISKSESSHSIPNDFDNKGGKIRLKISSYSGKKYTRNLYPNQINKIIRIQKVWKGYFLRKKINNFLKNYYSLFIFVSLFKNLLLKVLFYCVDKIKRYDKNLIKKRNFEFSLRISPSISKKPSIDEYRCKNKLEIETISSKSSEGKIFTNVYYNEVPNCRAFDIKIFLDENLKEIKENNFHIGENPENKEKKKNNIEYKKLYEILINKIALLEERQKKIKSFDLLNISNKENNIEIKPNIFEKKEDKLKFNSILSDIQNNKSNSELINKQDKPNILEKLKISNKKNSFQIFPNLLERKEVIFKSSNTLKISNNENNFQINSNFFEKQHNELKNNVTILKNNQKNSNLLENKDKLKSFDILKISNQKINFQIKPNLSLKINLLKSFNELKISKKENNIHIKPNLIGEKTHKNNSSNVLIISNKEDSVQIFTNISPKKKQNKNNFFDKLKISNKENNIQIKSTSLNHDQDKFSKMLMISNNESNVQFISNLNQINKDKIKYFPNLNISNNENYIQINSLRKNQAFKSFGDLKISESQNYIQIKPNLFEKNKFEECLLDSNNQNKQIKINLLAKYNLNSFKDLKISNHNNIQIFPLIKNKNENIKTSDVLKISSNLNNIEICFNLKKEKTKSSEQLKISKKQNIIQILSYLKKDNSKSSELNESKKTNNQIVSNVKQGKIKIFDELKISKNQNNIQISSNLIKNKKDKLKLTDKLAISNNINNIQIIQNLIKEKLKYINELKVSYNQNNIKIFSNSFKLKNKLLISISENNFQINSNERDKKLNEYKSFNILNISNNQNDIQINSNLKNKKLNKINSSTSLTISNKENDVQINSNFKSSFKYLLKENIISYNSFQGIKKFVNLTLERKISEDIIYDKYDKIKNFTLDHMNIEFNLVKHFQKSQKRKNIEKTKTEFIKFLGRKKPTLRKIRVETFKILTKRKSNILKKIKVENLKIITKKKLIIEKFKNENFHILSKKKNIIEKMRNENFSILNQKKIIIEKSIGNCFSLFPSKKTIMNNESQTLNEKIISDLYISTTENFKIIDNNKNKKNNEILEKSFVEEINIINNNSNKILINMIDLEESNVEKFNIINKTNKIFKNCVFIDLQKSKNEEIYILNKNYKELKKSSFLDLEKSNVQDIYIINKNKQVLNPIDELEISNINNKNNRMLRINDHIEKSKNEEFIIVNKNNKILNDIKFFKDLEKSNIENINFTNTNSQILELKNKKQINLKKSKIEDFNILKKKKLNLQILSNGILYIEGRKKDFESEEIQTLNEKEIFNKDNKTQYKLLKDSFQIISNKNITPKKIKSGGIIFKNRVMKTEWTKLPFAIEKYAKKFNHRLVCLLLVNYLRKKTKNLRIQNYEKIISKTLKRINFKLLQKYFYKYQFKILLEKIYEEKINRNNDLLFDLSFTENKNLYSNKSKDNSLNYINFAEIDYSKELEEPMKQDLKEKIGKIEISSIKNHEKKLSSFSQFLSPIPRNRKLSTQISDINVNYKELILKTIINKKIIKNCFNKWKEEKNDNSSINIDESFSFSMNKELPQRTLKVKSKKNNKDISIRYINKEPNHIRSISVFNSITNDSFLSISNSTIKKGMKVVYKIIDYKGKVKNIDPNLSSIDIVKNNNFGYVDKDKDKNILNKIIQMRSLKKHFTEWKNILKKKKRKFINVIIDMIKCLFSNNILLKESIRNNSTFQIEKAMLIWFRKRKKKNKKKNN